MSRLMRLVSIAACAPLLWVLFWVVVRPVMPSDRYSRGVVIALAVLALVLVPVLVWLVDRVAPWLERHPVVRRVGLVVVLATVFAVQVRTGIAIRIPPGWDAGVMESISHGLAFDYLTTAQAVQSINFYPNNALLTASLVEWLQLVHGFGVTDQDLQFVTLNALALCASIALSYAIARRLAGPTAAYVAGALAVATLTFSPWIGVVYSDTIGMVFTATIAWLFVRLRSATSRPFVAVLWVALALVGSLGYQVKPTVVFALGAAVLVSLLGLRWRTWTRGTVTWRVVVAGALAAGFLAGGAVGSRVVEHVGITPTEEAEQVALPVTHFLAMGAQSKSFWGAYYGKDVERMLALPPGEARFDNGIEVYRQRVEGMGVVGYAKFLHRKANWTYGDGSFFAFGEGGMTTDPMPYYKTDARSARIQEWLGPVGEHYGVVLAWWQVVWLTVLALVVVPAVWWRRRELFTEPATMLRLALLMLFAFLLLFEARPRYLYLYLPYFFVLASVSAVALGGGLRRLTGRRTTDDAAPAVTAT